MILRDFDLRAEGPERLFDLFRKVYGDSAAIERRWRWEWLEHPDTQKIRFHVAEDTDRIVGLTVRMPCRLQNASGSIKAYFATNSMIHPAYRGRGLIRQLYERAREAGALDLSKGTAECMYRQLLRMGYIPVQPDSYQVCLLRPWAWLRQRLGLSIKQSQHSDVLNPLQYCGYRLVDCFEAIPPLPVAGFWVEKDTEWLNWRYVNAPHRSYLKAVRYMEERPVAWCVLRVQGRTAYLVDLAWDRFRSDEPKVTVILAKRLARVSGAVKLVAWGAYNVYRRFLLHRGFIPASESPHFSIRWCVGGEMAAESGKLFHLAHGDGDIDYL
jgi:GNAT superfamily N-acetyltransferase